MELRKDGPVYSDECMKAFREISFCVAPEKFKQVSENFTAFLRGAKQSVPNAFSRGKFVNLLMETYFVLLDFKEMMQKAIVGDSIPSEADVFAAKKMILEAVVYRWGPSSDKESIRSFRFLIAAHSPLTLAFSRNEYESDYEIMARGRTASKAEKDKMEALMRERIKYWNVKDLEKWISQPFVPDEILNILILGRARNGGRDLSLRDIANAEFLEGFDLGAQSESAKNLAKNRLKKVADWDGEVQELRAKFMSASWRYTDRHANESVFEDIIIEYEEQPIGRGVALNIKAIINAQTISCEGDGLGWAANIRKDLDIWRDSGLSENVLSITLTVEWKGDILSQTSFVKGA